MGALAKVCFRTWMLSLFEHGCLVNALERGCYYGLGMDALVHALEHRCYHGLGMDALVNVCSRTWMLLWFGHGYPGKCMHENPRKNENLHETRLQIWPLLQLLK